ncbi:DsbA family protein [Sandarakinorhabdus rubra]|uniref:DsbA family protein n=1 Tax=Sandarakinorhabdus rubra TaxID=2672568 RepID=UPI001F1EED75|nr:DsbA family protein [Sandarakinorhabdus rubra]
MAGFWQRRFSMAATLALAVGSIALGAGASLAAAQNSSGKPAPDRAAIEAIVRDYILNHPEIIPEAVARLEQAEARKALAANRAAIETPFAGAIAGNPQGDVKLVVFFDYACPFCKQGHADVQRLVREDPKLMVVYRDFPVLSPASTEAAMASLSAAQQGRYGQFHDAMFASPGRVSLARTMGIVKGVGLDEKRTTEDLNSAALKAEVNRNLELGRNLGLTGTPSYVVGDRILSGAVGFDRLKEAVAAARAAKAA